MIKTFKQKEIESWFKENKTFPSRYFAIRKVLLRKLILLNDAKNLEDLKVPPGNKLEALLGKRKGQWSIRVNQQWRICFIFSHGDTYDVEIVDYH